MLKAFVENFSSVFGENSVSFNIHCLLHIADNVTDIDNLSSITAYSFENYLQKLKKGVKKPRKILEQIFKNITEEKIVDNPNLNGPKTKNNKIIGFYYKNCYFSDKSPNNYCFVFNGTMMEIVGFSRSNDKFIIGRKVLQLDNFFTVPIESSKIGILFGFNASSDIEEAFSMSQIKCKMMSLPFENGKVFISILHSLQTSV